MGRARIEATSKGFAQESEDFGQWLMERYVRGSCSKQTIRQSFIDYLREKFGRSKKSDGTVAENYERNSIPWDEEVGREYNKNATAHTKVTCDFLFIEKKYRPMAILRYKWGFSATEIGEVFNLSEGHVNSMFCEILKVLRTLDAIKEE